MYGSNDCSAPFSRRRGRFLRSAVCLNSAPPFACVALDHMGKEHGFRSRVCHTQQRRANMRELDHEDEENLIIRLALSIISQTSLLDC